MYNEPIFLKPVFQERIWGGKNLQTKFNYEIPYEHTGEAWVISAHENGPSVIQNGPLKGKTLADAWDNHGDLFNKSEGNNEKYPLLVKILDANDDLSVQVHPNDEFAREVENVPYGKTECWYVISAEEDSKLVLGHHADSRKEFENKIDKAEWDRLLRRVSVKAGDFVYVPSGTIHAIGKGIVILEIQQSSDITYRVYDYDRTDSEGNRRELHLERAKQVATIPHQNSSYNPSINIIEDLTVKRLVEEKYFTVEHWELKGAVHLDLEQDFLQVSVIEGSGYIQVGDKVSELTKGTNFVLPHGIDHYKLSGDLEIIVSWG
ncbi:mannose-6-phosphate isomerase, class I [Oceanobacillus caeni]|uniref:Mannose-6-phosphate isomerase n=1 Tax=Oceanobacillus caeni TaxID=405946 RepID=A0ABR5MHD6_9BACI|nr:mannose-6-phosphate isomerase, class I [Oceanobacillus caeni]KPH73429.1 mannose-6-phosphate isomerase [Oceanobacillus caeni]